MQSAFFTVQTNPMLFFFLPQVGSEGYIFQVIMQQNFCTSTACGQVKINGENLSEYFISNASKNLCDKIFSSLSKYLENLYGYF